MWSVRRIICLVVLGSAGVQAEYDICSVNTDCIGDHSVCFKPVAACSQGICSCSKGYAYSSQYKTCVGQYGQACDNTTYCEMFTHCGDSSTCECDSGYKYHTLLQACIPEGKSAISESCITDTDCYSSSSASCVLQKCKCKNGFVTESYRCRKPHVGEFCLPSVGCKRTDTGTMGLTSVAMETETCEYETYTCPKSAQKVSLTWSFNGQHKVIDFCQTTHGGELLDTGANCTASNECSSSACYRCEGATTSVCISPGFDVSKQENGSETSSLNFMVIIMTVVASKLW